MAQARVMELPVARPDGLAARLDLGAERPGRLLVDAEGAARNQRQPDLTDRGGRHARRLQSLSIERPSRADDEDGFSAKTRAQGRSSSTPLVISHVLHLIGGQVRRPDWAHVLASAVPHDTAALA
jgi:hypothetical protein